MDLTSQSLLLQARQGSEHAWERMVWLYRPFIAHWLQRMSVGVDVAPDMEQDVLATLVEQLPQFQHSGQPGAFRAWLRTVTVNRARLSWRRQHDLQQAPGGSDFLRLLAELEDPASGLSNEWNLDHQRHVVQTLLQELAQEFEPDTLEAFRRSALLDQDPSQVAQDLGMTVGAVYIAKSRVLRRLREKASDLLD